MNTLKALVGLCAFCVLLPPSSYADQKDDVAKLLETNTCQNCDLSNQDFTRANLSGANLAGADLTGASFLLADMAKANLQKTILDGAHFGGADLGGVDFTDARVAGADFAGAYTAGIIYKGDLVADSQKINTVTEEVIEVLNDDTNVPVATEDVQEAVAIKSTPSPESPNKATLPVTEEKNVVTKSTPAVVATSVVATETSNDSEVVATEFEEKDLAEEVEPIVDPVAEEIEETPLTAEEIRENRIDEIVENGGCYQCNLEGFDFSGESLEKVDFEQANLSGANFSKADLEGAIFRGADLRNVNFNKADLEGADFYKANLEGAILEGADIDDVLMDSANKESSTDVPFMLQN